MSTLSEDADWAADGPCEVMARALRHSLNFGLYHADQQMEHICPVPWLP